MEVKENVKEVSFATLVKIDADYVKVTVNSGASIDTAEMDEILAAYDSFFGPGQQLYILTVLPADLNPSRELRDYWRQPGRSQRKKAEAIVIEGTAMTIIAKFMSKMERPLHRVSYFKTEQEAHAWLQAEREKAMLARQ